MKKKLLVFLCVITCMLGLVGCGDKVYTANETKNMNSAISKSANLADLCSVSFQTGIVDENITIYDCVQGYKKHENVAFLEEISNAFFGYYVSSDFGVFEGLLTTYQQANEDMGGIVLVDTNDAEAEIIGKNIIVTIPVQGTAANGEFKFEYTNDAFGTLTAAECTAKLSLKQNLKKAGGGMRTAALNTLLGMGTVFIVLILISLIISGFTLLNRPNKPVETKKAEEAVNENEVSEDLSDDMELVAVITAAISAYEGNSSTDGFVVRSIRRANRRN